MKLPTTLLVTLAIVTAAVPTRARAQPSDSSAAAELLFDDAKALMAHGEYDRACPKLEASLKLEPALGTRVNLADCYEAIGKLASAWSMFRAAADVARVQRDPREKLATDRAAKLESRLSRLSVVVEGTPPRGLTIVRSGTAVEPAMLGTPIYVDPGRTVITATAPGYATFETTIDVKEAQLSTVEIPPMTREAATPATPIVDSIAPPVAHTERPRDPGRRRLGLAIAGGGLVLAGTGLAFGWSARGAWDEAFAGGDCARTTNVCNAHGQELADKARSRGRTRVDRLALNDATN